MDVPCSIQGNIHVFSLIKKCVQDSGYISFARFFYFVVFRSHSLLDFLESRVMKRKSINHCQSRSEMERWTRTPEGTWNVLRTLEETHAISAILNSTTPGYEKKALKTIRLVLKSRNPYKKCTHNCYCECIFCLDSNF